jgi:uncharacterized protein (TIGR00297 family)
VADLTRTVETLAGLGPARPLWTALIVTVVFTTLARWVRGVSFSGAIAGAAVCFLLYVGAGLGAFVALVSVFALTWISTRFGYRRKEKLGTAEKLDGRTASQVLANLAVAASCAGLSALTAKAVFLLAVSAALSEAAADTVSSELGQARSAKARLITTWAEVAAGTDGGVSCRVRGESSERFNRSAAAQVVGHFDHRRSCRYDRGQLVGRFAGTPETAE